MNQPRIFYCVYLPAGKPQTVLDAVRLIANPTVKHSAHITVRGPYSLPQDARYWSEIAAGHIVHVSGVDTFFGPSQNTVVLRVESDVVRHLWHKPDYPGYHPHVTVYDGPSRSFAEDLRSLLSTAKLDFSFRIDGIAPLASGGGHLPLRSRFDLDVFSNLLGRSVTLAELDEANALTRLDWIAGLVDRLALMVD